MTIGPCSPFFIVSDLPRSVRFYIEQLNFENRMTAPDEDPFFAIVGRGAAQILLKTVGPEVAPQPNPSRHAWVKWDCFIHAADPDALADELTARGTQLRTDLGDTDDGLRGFEVADADGYVLFFGRPV